MLIHCYGKVGSITIEKALSKFLHKIELVRTHFMVPYEANGASMTNNRSRQKFFKPRNGKKFIMTGRDFMIALCHRFSKTMASFWLQLTLIRPQFLSTGRHLPRFGRQDMNNGGQKNFLIFMKSIHSAF